MRFFFWFCVLVLTSATLSPWQGGNITADAKPVHSCFKGGSCNLSGRSITFLPSGYRESKHFEDDVKKCVDVLKGAHTGRVISEPWSSYASGLNIHTVFEPSRDAAAGGAMNASEKHINLGCVVNTEAQPSFIKCNLSAVFRLASYAPVQDLVVVLVNEPMRVSGVGGKSLAVFTNNEEFMPFFTIRELSKAVASLGSEYSTGIEENTNNNDVSIPNCASSVEMAEKEWGYWMEQKEVDATPSKGCFFNNFYRPTRSNCMMHNSSVDGLCAVCKEKVNLALLSFNDDKNKNISAEGKCCKTEYIHVPGGRGNVSQHDIKLTVKGMVGMTHVEVTWLYKNGSRIVTPPTPYELQISPNSSLLGSLPNEICAVIQDNSPYIRPELRKSLPKEVISFILVSSTSSSLTATNCGISTSCVQCNNNNRSQSVNMKWVEEKGMKTGRRTYFISAGVLLGTFIIVFFIKFTVYKICYLRRPREIFSLFFMENLICGGILLLFIIILCLTIYALASIIQVSETRVIFSKQLFIPAVLTLFIYASSLIAFIFFMFRQYVLIIICGIVLFLIGLFYTVMGALLGVSNFLNQEDALINYVASQWLKTVKVNPDDVERIQSHLRCSGFFVSCLEVTSSECPRNSETNMYPNPCHEDFMDVVRSARYPLAVFMTITGILLILYGFFLFVFVMRLKHLSKVAQQRRSYRNDPHAKTIPVTYAEIRRARTLFYEVADTRSKTLSGPSVTNFLKKTFNAKLTSDEKHVLESQGPVTFEKLMSLFSPYLVPSRVDPRQLTPEEIEEKHGVIALQEHQYEKIWQFATASDTLSPEALLNLYREHTQEYFIVDYNIFLSLIKEKAKDSPDASICKGLTPMELEALRNAWVALNPNVSGDLTDEQIELFYEWTHNRPIRNEGEFEKWKQSLDVRHRNGIGWGEFCYPFARRTLLCRARGFLESIGKDVPPELLTKDVVHQRFGDDVVNATFLEYEEEIPIERVFEHILSSKKKKTN